MSNLEIKIDKLEGQLERQHVFVDKYFTLLDAVMDYMVATKSQLDNDQIVFSDPEAFLRFVGQHNALATVVNGLVETPPRTPIRTPMNRFPL